MQKRTGLGNALPIAAGLLLLWFGGGANAMNFTLARDQLTVHASGPIERGDAAKFAALPKFDTLELDSPGGLVGEALAMAANMDARRRYPYCGEAGRVLCFRVRHGAVRIRRNAGRIHGWAYRHPLLREAGRHPSPRM